MKHVDEWRDPKTAKAVAQRIHEVTTRPWRIMEVCGGQTHALVRFGIDRLLPEQLTLKTQNQSKLLTPYGSNQKI